MTVTSTLHRLFLAALLSLALFSLTTQAWATKHPYYSKHPKAAKELERLLRQAQLQPLEMQPAGLSVTLRDVNNKDRSLEDFQGKVLVFTKWATWCGACRAEMPQKLQLQQNIKNPRLVMIGVSSESQDKVAAYLKSNTTTYPINLLDPDNKMSSFFPGNAIPVTILVDGWGWTVAMKRGGAPWTRSPYVALMNHLLRTAPTKRSLEKNIPKPLVSYPQEVKVPVGQAFSVVFHVDWIGANDKFSQISFDLGTHPALQFLGMSTKGVSNDQSSNKRQYVMRMKLSRSAKLDAIPVKIRYQLKDYDKSYTMKVGDLSIQVASQPTTKSATKKWPYILLGSAGLLVLVIFFLLGRQGSNENGPSEEDVARQKREEALQALVSNLKEAHNGNDPKKQIEPIYDIYHSVLDDVPQNVRTLRDDIRYGGHDFPTDKRRQVLSQLAADLKSDFPDVAKRIQAM
ncbi:MAG: TlpA family protein disulfide reductase [Deltaproteobacteria bacterium]|nr:MAG: TlpA family protein disulfide reductase [Deltaproteobacteria bacterium]